MIIEQQNGKVLIDGSPMDPDDAEALAEELTEMAEKARADYEFQFESSLGTPFRVNHFGRFVELFIRCQSPGFLMDRPLALQVAEAIRSLALRLPE